MPPNSVNTWAELETKFHDYFSNEHLGRVPENMDFREWNGKKNMHFIKDSDSASESEEAEVNVAEWVKGSKKPLVCSWLAPKKPAQSEIMYTFDVSKRDQIFDLRLQQKLIRVPESHIIPSAEELKK